MWHRALLVVVAALALGVAQVLVGGAAVDADEAEATWSFTNDPALAKEQRQHVTFERHSALRPIPNTMVRRETVRDAKAARLPEQKKRLFSDPCSPSVEVQYLFDDALRCVPLRSIHNST